MMHARKIVPLLALAALIAILAMPVHGQTGIIVNNADTVRQEGVRLDTSLGSATSSVSPRIVLQHANTKREERITAPPADLQARFAQVPARIVLQYANAVRQEQVATPPADLLTLFGQVVDRIVLQYANTCRQVTLAYPVALIGDSAAPLVSNVKAQNVGGGAKVTWTTDEFATSEVRYGTSPGVYTQTVSDSLYEKQHALTLTGLAPNTMYYFVVRGADRSGNQAQSGEYQVRALAQIYLPEVLRR